MDSHGEHGGIVGELAALFVCGAPGTSGVKWCCESAVKSWGSRPTPALCHVNAGHLLSNPDPWQSIVGEIGASLGIKTKTPKKATPKRRMTRHEEDPNNTFLSVVVDEVDALVSSSASDIESGHVRRENCLRNLLEWAKDPDKQMALIGICFQLFKR